jgi:hypothetical protein
MYGRCCTLPLLRSAGAAASYCCQLLLCTFLRVHSGLPLLLLLLLSLTLILARIRVLSRNWCAGTRAKMEDVHNTHIHTAHTLWLCTDCINSGSSAC